MKWLKDLIDQIDSGPPWHERTRGETIVEVLLATVILSSIIAGAYTLSNRATRIGQSSIERTEAVNLVESMAETLKGVSSVRGEAWNEIVSNHVGSTAPSYSDPTVCEATVGSPFYLNIDNFTDLEEASIVEAGQFRRELDSGADDLFEVWIEAYSPEDASYIDFHVRTCWEGISAATVERATAVLRINTGPVGVWDSQ